jgi:hypothetical protein
MAKTFKINRLLYQQKYMPELLFVCAKASVQFSNPITPLKSKYRLNGFHYGFFKECRLVLSVFKLVQQIKSLFTCSALFGGNRNNNGKFNNMGNNGNFWSSTENNSNNAWNMNINSNNKKANMNNNNRSVGRSVRCVQHWDIYRYSKAVFICS